MTFIIKDVCYVSRSGLATLKMNGAARATKAIPISLISPNDLGNLSIEHYQILNFSSNDEKGPYLIKDKVFDPKRIGQQVQPGDYK